MTVERVRFGPPSVLAVALPVFLIFAVFAGRAWAQEHAIDVTGTDGTAVWVEGVGGEVNDNYGIYAEDDDNDGVFGWSFGDGDADTGVTGRAESGYGIYAFTLGSGQYGGYFADPIYVNGGCTGCTMSLVARNESAELLRPGDTTRVVGVDASLSPASPILKVMPGAPDQPVLGVVLGRVETVMLDASNDTQAGLHFGPIGEVALPGDHLIVVVQGLARVRLDAGAGVKAGDRISVGSSGATRVDEATTAPVIGMAVEPPDTEGMAWVLVGIGTSPRF